MHITSFGFFFIPLALFIALLGGENLVYLLIFSSVFQAASVLNFDAQFKFGLQPYYFVSFLVVITLVLNIIGSGGRLRVNPAMRGVAALLIFFCFYAGISSLILPVVYDGITVYSPRLGIDPQAEFGGVPLHWNYSNFAQAIYVALNVINVIFVLTNGEKIKHARVSGWLIFSAIFVAIIGFYQLLANYSGLYFPFGLLYSSPTYYIGDNQILDGILRMNSTFSEPSLAGLFLASTAIYCFVFSLGKNGLLRFLYFSAALAVALAAAATTSTTAYIVLLAGFASYFLVEVIFALRSGKISKISIFGALFIFALAAASLILIFAYGLLPAFYAMTVDKTHTLSYAHRQLSNMVAFDLTLKTGLLGVGLGSNRPSSFIAYLLSNLGLIGTFPFFIVLYKLLNWGSFYNNKIRGVGYAPELFLLCVFLGMSAAVPDLSFGVLWVAIICVISHRIEDV